MRHPELPHSSRIVFIGAGNMASAILQGLVRHGLPTQQLAAVDPSETARERLQKQLGIAAHATMGTLADHADLVVWAIKPQTFAAAARDVAAAVRERAQLSIMAGIRLPGIAAATGGTRIVRCMPNTPALIGRGMTALFAPPGVAAADRALAEAVMRCAGDALWVEREEQLDAVTALSGSGPAYVFYFLEAMVRAGTELGLSPEQARHLATQTFAGGAALAAAQPDEPLATLRERVTSKGGTTFAALTTMASADVGGGFIRAMHAACERAQALGDAFGA